MAGMARDCVGGGSRDKPAVILSAIENIVDENRIILNLIKDKIPFATNILWYRFVGIYAS